MLRPYPDCTSARVKKAVGAGLCTRPGCCSCVTDRYPLPSQRAGLDRPLRFLSKRLLFAFLTRLIFAPDDILSRFHLPAEEVIPAEPAPRPEDFPVRHVPKPQENVLKMRRPLPQEVQDASRQLICALFHFFARVQNQTEEPDDSPKPFGR